MTAIAEPPALADVEIDADGALPASLLPSTHSHVEAEHVNQGRLYKLTTDPVPPEFAALTTSMGVSDYGYYGIQHMELTSVYADGVTAKAILGGEEDNVLLGNNARDILIGQDGDDRLSGGAADDLVYGGAGDDILAGGSGADRLDGGRGDDRYEIGGLNDGAVDTIFDMDGANLVDFDGVDGAQLSFGMDGADLVVAVDGTDAVRVSGFEGDDSTFDILADDAHVTHAALVSAVEEMRAAFDAGARTPMADVLDGWLGTAQAAPPNDPVGAFAQVAADAPVIEVSPPEPLAVEDGGGFDVAVGAATHNETASGLAGKHAGEEDQVAVI